MSSDNSGLTPYISRLVINSPTVYRNVDEDVEMKPVEDVSENCYDEDGNLDFGYGGFASNEPHILDLIAEMEARIARELEPGSTVYGASSSNGNG